MARNSNLITHIIQDTNSKYHLAIGLVVALAITPISVIFNTNYAPAALSMISGIAIEVYQRVAQNGQNTTRESVFDALTTALPGVIVSCVLYAVVAT